MKKSILLIFLSLQFLTSFSQTKEIKDEYMWGKLENGQKVGLWQYYDEPGELSLRVNHSTGQLSFIKRDTSKYLINQEGQWIERQVVTPPHFIGSRQHVKDYLSKNIRFPKQARVRGINGVTVISAVIDQNGSIGYFEIIKKLESGYSEEVIRVLNAVPNTWIPATNSAGRVASKIIFIIRFGIGGDYKVTKKEKRKYPILQEEKPYIISLAKEAIGIDKLL